MEIKEEVRGKELHELCAEVKKLLSSGQYDECHTLICEAMEYYPNAPQPHNLLGIMMERTGDHVGAMKHFRAAWALDPTYSPAGQNLAHYSMPCLEGKDAFDEGDCRPEKQESFEVQYDSRGIGHMLRRY